MSWSGCLLCSLDVDVRRSSREGPMFICSLDMDVRRSSREGSMLTHGASGKARLSRLSQQVVLEHHGQLSPSR